MTLATRARYGAVSDAETRPRVSWFVRKIDLSVKTGSQPTLNALLRWRRAWTCRLAPTSPRSFIVVPLTLASLGLAYKLQSGSCHRQNVAESVAIPFESPPPPLQVISEHPRTVPAFSEHVHVHVLLTRRVASNRTSAASLAYLTTCPSLCFFCS